MIAMRNSFTAVHCPKAGNADDQRQMRSPGAARGEKMLRPAQSMAAMKNFQKVAYPAQPSQPQYVHRWLHVG